ncbi:4Fe-4S ferredoxin iron-sulfur binding domain-containing protein [Oleidesulfovibrio alaskensis G20]|jgi:tetrathionate reductase subunit B|uniref:4Fe-4S ferredoxin iron-sulfur binding domain-containing protein n=1 Tax=Oleidesulfovibrio alaskensis (strain ATCC BAA-1058 / DSM 17464 / G20) TaxID=207559 RepID=Q315B4_OLEA2|nr:4Fe-4S dicluster domain-containing protein [Oleidesulfovibrio alaskensis]ABB37482.1 4Fe-4S ferredoxin iron-sulfur binding domain-containing protein [Oleidesulfovibrio alaskensis G20]MBG0774655.1 4Fe-4S dicluster domain-containing protein [Oleidesulfovibrio alaskensis]
MTQQFAMVIDSARCIDCKACVVSCKVANNVPAGFSRNWIKADGPVVKAGKGPFGHFQPGACMHCESPTCVEACPTGATWKDRETGIVEIDPALCIGCGNCIPACPYGARFRNPQRRIADKCNYCPERRAAGLPPACVDTCPTKARVFGDILNPETEAARLLTRNSGHVTQLIHEKSNTAPHMYYVGGTAPAGWMHEAKAPASMRALTGVVAPGVKGLVALSGLGVLVMLGRQLLDSRKSGDGGHDRPHASGSNASGSSASGSNASGSNTSGTQHSAPADTEDSRE